MPSTSTVSFQWVQILPQSLEEPTGWSFCPTPRTCTSGPGAKELPVPNPYFTRCQGLAVIDEYASHKCQVVFGIYHFLPLTTCRFCRENAGGSSTFCPSLRPQSHSSSCGEPPRSGFQSRYSGHRGPFCSGVVDMGRMIQIPHNSKPPKCERTRIVSRRCKRSIPTLG